MRPRGGAMAPVSMQLTIEEEFCGSKARWWTTDSSLTLELAKKLSLAPAATIADSHSVTESLSGRTALMCPAACSRRAT